MEIAIVTAADKNYEQHTAVMLASLFKNSANSHFRIFLLCPELNKEQLRLQQFVEKKGHRLERVQVNEGLMQDFKVTHHVSLATYYRLFIPEIIPVEVDRVLYLDSDMVILEDILPLWQTDLTGYLAAAVAEKEFDRHEALNIDKDHVYFNAGVLLLDLKKIGEGEFTKKAIDYLNGKQEEILFWDQDVLNYMLQGNVKLISSDWNRFRPVNNELINPINILHYVGSVKPWNYPQDNNYDKYYFKYLLKTPWFFKMFTKRAYWPFLLKN